MTGPMPEGSQGGQPHQQGPGEPSPWHPQQPGPQPPKSRTGLIIGLVIAGVALLMVIVLVVVIALVIGLGKRGGADGDDAAKPASPEEQVSALAKDYMDSLVAGDPGPALALVADRGYHEATALDEDAYATALEEAPIADVSIGEPQMSALSGEVTVQYTVGGESASGELHMADNDDDGTYELVTALDSTLDVPDRLTGLQLAVNGSEVEPGERYVALPGSYALEIDEELFTLDGETTFLLGAGDPSPDWPDAALTDDGQKAFRSAVKTSVEKCLAQKTLEAGCGLQTIQGTSSDGWKAKDKTVERTLPGSSERALDKLTARPGTDEATYVTADGSIGSIDATMECSKGSQSGTCDLLYGGGFGTPSVDLADEDRPVTWD